MVKPTTKTVHFLKFEKKLPFFLRSGPVTGEKSNIIAGYL